MSEVNNISAESEARGHPAETDLALQSEARAAQNQQDPPDDAPAKLWERDTGTLRKASRVVLAALLKGPYISAEKQTQNWRALLADTDQIRSRLADMFLDLVIDDERGIAFVRNAETYDDAPQVVRTSALTVMDTAMLLHLRRELVSASGPGRVIVGKDEIFEHLQTYRTHISTDDAGFTKRINSAWTKMDKLGILLRTPTSATDGRFEVSPVLRLIFGPEQIEAVRAEYAKLRGEAPGTEPPRPQADHDDYDEGDEFGPETGDSADGEV